MDAVEALGKPLVKGPRVGQVDSEGSRVSLRAPPSPSPTDDATTGRAGRASSMLPFRRPHEDVTGTRATTPRSFHPAGNRPSIVLRVACSSCLGGPSRLGGPRARGRPRDPQTPSPAP